MTKEELILMRKVYGNHFDNCCNQEQLLEAYKMQQEMTVHRTDYPLHTIVTNEGQCIMTLEEYHKAINEAERRGMKRILKMIDENSVFRVLPWLNREEANHRQEKIEKAIRAEAAKIGEGK